MHVYIMRTSRSTSLIINKSTTCGVYLGYGNTKYVTTLHLKDLLVYTYI